MTDPNLTLLESAARLLQPLLDELVFVGGCATGLFITDPAAGGIRPTKDVDTITEVSSYAEYVTLSERLRALKLHECRIRNGTSAKYARVRRRPPGIPPARFCKPGTVRPSSTASRCTRRSGYDRCAKR